MTIGSEREWGEHEGVRGVRGSKGSEREWGEQEGMRYLKLWSCFIIKMMIIKLVLYTNNLVWPLGVRGSEGSMREWGEWEGARGVRGSEREWGEQEGVRGVKGNERGARWSKGSKTNVILGFKIKVFSVEFIHFQLSGCYLNWGWIALWAVLCQDLGDNFWLWRQN